MSHRSPIARRGAIHAPKPDTYSATVLADTPQAYWKLNDPSGTTAVDSSGNGHDGTYTGGFTLGQTGSPGSADEATTFDGSTGRVLIPTPLSGFGTFSIEAWIKPTSIPGSFATPVSIGGGQSGTTNGGASFRIYGSLALHFLYPNVIDSASGLSIVLNAWNHLVLTRDGTTSRMYVNGTVGGTTITNAPNNSGQSSTIAAQEENAPADWFAGTIQHVAAYSAALSGTRIAAHYAAGS